MCATRGRRRRRGVSLSMKSRPILLDMTDRCAAAAADDLPSPTHLGTAGDGGAMTTLDYGVCELIPTTADPTDWRHTPVTVVPALCCWQPESKRGKHTPVTIHRATYDEARSTPAAAVALDCCAEHSAASVGRKWSSADDDVEFDGRVCCAAAYHHHLNTTGGTADLSTTSSGVWSPAAVSPPSSSTSSSFRPSAVRTTANAAARMHVYDMPLFHS